MLFELLSFTQFIKSNLKNPINHIYIYKSRTSCTLITFKSAPQSFILVSELWISCYSEETCSQIGTTAALMDVLMDEAFPQAPARGWTFAELINSQPEGAVEPFISTLIWRLSGTGGVSGSPPQAVQFSEYFIKQPPATRRASAGYWIHLCTPAVSINQPFSLHR